MCVQLTGTHVAVGTSLEGCALPRLRRQAEVAKLHAKAVFAEEDVLRLQIAVEHALLVTCLDGVEHLEKRVLD